MNTVNYLSDSIVQYRSRIKKNREFFDYAKSTSYIETLDNLKDFKSSKDRKALLRSLLKVTKSSIWLSRSAMVLLKSYFDIRSVQNEHLKNSRSQEIIAGVTNKRTVEASDAEIFKIIYDEIAYSHLHMNYRTKFKTPKSDVTIVLVSGVFNEIFSTAAFKRGAEKLLDECHIDHITANVSGAKGSKENAEILERQVGEYLKLNPDAKLWFFCFSKGGVDALHYLKKNGESVPKNILGISFIATPILGSEHIEKTILKVANKIVRGPELITSRLLGKEIDLRASNLQKSLHKPYRESWFKRNHKLLPKNLFYTAVAFESTWHDAHVYMILTKAIFRSKKSNDGIVDVENAQFPSYFSGLNLGVLEGHHLVGSRSSYYDQEALMKAHLVFLNYKKLL